MERENSVDVGPSSGGSVLALRFLFLSSCHLLIQKENIGLGLAVMAERTTTYFQGMLNRV